MVFTFARVGAAIGMKVEGYFIQGRRGWVRLHEKGGKRHDVLANHNLDEYLEAYIKGVDLEADPKGPLFRTAVGKSDALTRRALSQADAYRMMGLHKGSSMDGKAKGRQHQKKRIKAMSNPSDQESGGWLESRGFGALDWASEKHSVVVVDPQGKVLEDFEIDHSALEGV